MYDDSAHPLLAQVPLTVSPFLSLPTTPTLPYTYKSLPTTLPPSSTPNEAYINAPQSNQSFTPAALLATTTALRTHLTETRENAARDLTRWEEEMRARELAEKRRVAPGWLDREEKMLEPERRTESSASMRMAGKEGGGLGTPPLSQGALPSSSRTEASDGRAEVEGSIAALEMGEGRVSPQEVMGSQAQIPPAALAQGEELDRAFGAMGVK